MVISLQNLVKYYGDVVGIKDITFSVDRGEIFGFLGPNGAGKTTTIRLLLNLLHPTSGNILIFGESVSRKSLIIKEKCGYLPGNFSAYKQMTGSEYLAFMAKIRKIAAEKQMALIKRFEFSARDLSKKIKHLSHGTLQKLGIVQAFFHDPELLILDEPTIGLDPLMQEVFYELVREYRNAGTTIFFSSHNLPEVEKVCDRVGIIREGKLVALETLESLKKIRFRRLEIFLRQPIENFHIPNARLISQNELHYIFLVKGDVEQLLKNLVKYPIANMVFPEPDLEEVFIAYYGKNSND